MTKEERIESDKKLHRLYTELFAALDEATEIADEISQELEENIQGECQENWMAKKLVEELRARTDWAYIGQRAWKILLEKDSK